MTALSHLHDVFNPFHRAAPLTAALLAALAVAGCGADRLGEGPTGGGGTGGSGGDATSGSGGEGPAIVDEAAPLGAHVDAHGHLQIAVRSLRAERLEAWLYAAPAGEAERHVVVLEPREGGVFRGVVPASVLAAKGLDETAYYGLRAWGPGWAWDPAWTPGSEIGFVADVGEAGDRFDPNKLLLDPYAEELSHDPRTPDHDDGWIYTTGPDHRAEDSALVAPKGIVLRPGEGGVGARPARPLADQIVYEVHVRGFTRADASLPEAIRGTYAGAAAKAGYLADLGVTAIELLPLHETQNEQNDVDPASAAGDNYWGYSSLSFFAPERRYAADRSPGGPTREVQAMVKAFHDAGIAVLVDVVYNHTAEGGAWDASGAVAPLLSWRGLDNTGYYELGKDPAHYQNDNGVGPNLAATSPLARDLVIDSLRYWHEVLGVDGFRFDLAAVLANGCEQGCYSFDPGAPGGILRRASEELPGAILVAEPWGTTAGTYQAGHFPQGWAEWNDRFRDTMRDDQNRDGVASVTPGWLADRLSGSWSVFGDDGRPPWRSINYLVSHDGLTLRDLYGCNDKKNDQPWPWGPSDGGSDDNRAWDQGGDPAAQRQAARTGLALLMVSAGVPMITGGDEMYRTQKCNNNPYNLDSPGSWLDWTDAEKYAPFHRFARKLLRFRNAHPALRPHDYRPLADTDGNGLAAITFLRDDGEEADPAYLDNPGNDFLAFRIDGAEAGDPARSLLVAYNGWKDGIVVHLPAPAPGHAWYLMGDTHPWLEGDDNFFTDADAPALDEPTYLLGARSVLLLVERP